MGGLFDLLKLLQPNTDETSSDEKTTPRPEKGKSLPGNTQGSVASRLGRYHNMSGGGGGSMLGMRSLAAQQGGLDGFTNLLSLNNAIASTSAATMSPQYSQLRPYLLTQNMTLQPTLELYKQSKENENSLLSAQANKINADASLVRKQIKKLQTFTDPEEERRKKELEKIMFNSQIQDASLSRRMKEAQIEQTNSNNLEAEMMRRLRSKIVEAFLPKMISLLKG